MTTTPRTPVEKIQPGDVLFFAPPVLEPTRLDQFAQLAAVVQSLPYGRSMPWHHVAVAAPPAAGDDGPAVIGFELIADAPGSPWDSVLEATPWAAASKGEAITAIRLPGAGDSIVSASQEQVRASTRYSSLALLAFAVASQAAFFREGPARHRLYAYAAGLQLLPVEAALAGETCVTAAVQALEVSGVAVKVELPPAPADTIVPEGSLEGLIARMQAGSAALGLELALDNAEDALLTTPQIHAGYTADPFLVGAPGPDIVTTAQYLELLAASIRALAGLGVSNEEIIDLGMEGMAGRAWPTGRSWASSPAMLHEALLAAGGVPVT